MRLTLRTLLAYLDDILEPAQAKELGEKINDSGFAAGLVSRILDVMRRRRLTAPAVSGSGMGVDPNTVAEYLDNTLAPEAVADVEKVCLDSDVHLAEVAACHQVLTLVLGEPVDVTTETRERMYALGPVTRMKPTPAEEDTVEGLDPVRVPHSPPATAAIGTLSAPPVEEEQLTMRTQPQAKSEAFRNTVPEYLRDNTAWKRFVPYTVVALIAVFWLLSLFTNSPFSAKPKSEPKGGKEGVPVFAAKNGNVPAVVAQNDAAKLPASDETPFVPGPPVETRVPLTGTEVATTVEPTRRPLEPMPVPEPDVEPAVPKSAPVTVVTTPTETTVPPREVAAAKTPATVPPPPPPIPDPPAPAPQQAIMPTAKYVSPEGIVLQYMSKDQKWFVFPHNSVVYGGDLLAVPEPFDADMEIGDGRGSVTIHGDTVIRCLGQNAVAPFGWELRRGRMLIKSARGTEPAAPLTVGIEVRGELWGIEFQSPDTAVHVEVVPDVTTQFEQVLSRNSYSGVIYVSAGSVRLFHATYAEQVLAGPARFALPAVAPGSVARPVPVFPLGLVSRLGQPESTAMKQYNKLFEKAFSLDSPVELSIVGTVEDRRPAMSKLAVDTLALIGAHEPLIEALKRSSGPGGHEEARLAAIVGLRAWLPLAPENRDLLKADLAKTFTPVDADIVYRLLWGFNVEDAKNPVTSQQLVTWMDHDEISIRELAFQYVQKLTDKKFDYRPNAPPEQRKLSLNRWWQHIKNAGALLPK